MPLFICLIMAISNLNIIILSLPYPFFQLAIPHSCSSLLFISFFSLLSKINPDSTTEHNILDSEWLNHLDSLNLCMATELPKFTDDCELLILDITLVELPILVLWLLLRSLAWDLWLLCTSCKASQNILGVWIADILFVNNTGLLVCSMTDCLWSLLSIKITVKFIFFLIKDYQWANFCKLVSLSIYCFWLIWARAKLKELCHLSPTTLIYDSSIMIVVCF